MTDLRRARLLAARRDGRRPRRSWPTTPTCAPRCRTCRCSSSAFRQVDVDLNLRGPDMEKLQEYAEKIADLDAASRGTTTDVDTSLSLRKPELQVRPDRERLSDLGVSLQSVSTTLNVLVGGEPVTQVQGGDEQYDVWLRAELPAATTARPSPGWASRRRRPPAGTVRLRQRRPVRGRAGPTTIERYNRQRQVVVSANLQARA